MAHRLDVMSRADIVPRQLPLDDLFKPDQRYGYIYRNSAGKVACPP
jgi:hypothetical protein